LDAASATDRTNITFYPVFPPLCNLPPAPSILPFVFLFFTSPWSCVLIRAFPSFHILLSSPLSFPITFFFFFLGFPPEVCFEGRCLSPNSPKSLSLPTPWLRNTMRLFLYLRSECAGGCVPPRFSLSLRSPLLGSPDNVVKYFLLFLFRPLQLFNCVVLHPRLKGRHGSSSGFFPALSPLGLRVLLFSLVLLSPRRPGRKPRFSLLFSP